jgi:hypothetical protein
MAVVPFLAFRLACPRGADPVGVGSGPCYRSGSVSAGVPKD